MPTDETLAELKKLDAELGSILANRVYLGGNEQDKAYMLSKRVKALIHAEPVEPLATEARKFVDTFAKHIERAKERARELHAEAAENEKRQHDARKQREAAIAAKLAAQDERRRAEARAVVGEVIG